MYFFLFLGCTFIKIPKKKTTYKLNIKPNARSQGKKKIQTSMCIVWLGWDRNICHSDILVEPEQSCQLISQKKKCPFPQRVRMSFCLRGRSTSHPTGGRLICRRQRHALSMHPKPSHPIHQRHDVLPCALAHRRQLADDPFARGGGFVLPQQLAQAPSLLRLHLSIAVGTFVCDPELVHRCGGV
jgi:hypothetical protein